MSLTCPKRTRNIGLFKGDKCYKCSARAKKDMQTLVNSQENAPTDQTKAKDW